MNRYQTQSGFTLVEIAIVLLIVGVLARTLLEPLNRAQSHKQVEQTNNELQLIKDSLHAHLIAYGYLPCPITQSSISSASTSITSTTSTNCKNMQGGVPAALLGLSGAIDSHGALLDAWNNPYRYAVSLSNHASRGDQRLPDWTTAGEASRVGLRHLTSNLVLCTKPSRDACAKHNVRASNLVFVVLSQGKDASSSGAQLENQDNDAIYIVKDWSLSVDSAFDDQIVWSSNQDALYWMLRAAWLP